MIGSAFDHTDIDLIVHPGMVDHPGRAQRSGGLRFFRDAGAGRHELVRRHVVVVVVVVVGVVGVVGGGVGEDGVARESASLELSIETTSAGRTARPSIIEGSSFDISLEIDDVRTCMARHTKIERSSGDLSMQIDARQAQQSVLVCGVGALLLFQELRTFDLSIRARHTAIKNSSFDLSTEIDVG